jgi:hypothetical protein
MTDRTATMRAVTVGTPPMTAVAVCTGAGLATVARAVAPLGPPGPLAGLVAGFALVYARAEGL